MNQLNNLATFLSDFQQKFEMMYALVIVVACVMVAMLIFLMIIMYQNMGLKERIIRLEGYNNGKAVDRA